MLSEDLMAKPHQGRHKRADIWREKQKEQLSLEASTPLEMLWQYCLSDIAWGLANAWKKKKS